MIKKSIIIVNVKSERKTGMMSETEREKPEEVI